MKVGHLMTPDVGVVAPGDTLKAAAQLMAEFGFEALPVGEDDRLVGTITGCDIALQVAAAGGHPEQITVHQAMSADVLYCFDTESARSVLTKMRDWWVRRLPVVDPDKRLLGTISLGDLTLVEAAARKVKATRGSRPRRARPGRGPAEKAAA